MIASNSWRLYEARRAGIVRDTIAEFYDLERL